MTRHLLHIQSPESLMCLWANPLVSEGMSSSGDGFGLANVRPAISDVCPPPGCGVTLKTAAHVQYLTPGPKCLFNTLQGCGGMWTMHLQKVS
jgi:hypothetical protein